MQSVSKCLKQSNTKRNRRPLQRRNERKSDKERDWKGKSCKEEERNVLGEQEERTCCHQNKESCCCYECSSYKEAQHKKLFDHFYILQQMLSASEYVIQPVFPHSDTSSSVSSVMPPLVSSFHSTSYDAEPNRQTFSSQEKPDLDAEDCECSFFYEPYCKDAKEWLERACGR